MLSRISILSFIAALTILLSGECGIDIQTQTTSQQQTETIISDADIPNPTSLLSGQASSRTSSNSRRSMQRTISKRIDNLQVATNSDTASAPFIANSHYTIESNILGGVVSEKAFYSLCCLRI